MRGPGSGALALALLALGLPEAAGSPQEASTAAVTFEDGSTIPLSGWSLSYEYISWRAGTPQAMAAAARKDVKELLIGKKSYPVAGRAIEVQYEDALRREGPRTVRVPVARALMLVDVDGRKTPLKLEAPARELILPGTDKSLTLLVRTLDLKGETFTGTKREICLVSFTALVQCDPGPSEQVVRIQFQ
jgi:hypothetical protein